MYKFLQKKDEANPLAFMRRVSEELDRAFGLRANIFGQPEFYSKVWSPEIEVFERDNKFFVHVDLPGLIKEDVKIAVTHDELTIEGERSFAKEEKEKGFYRTERTVRQVLPDHRDSGAREGRGRSGDVPQRRA